MSIRTHEELQDAMQSEFAWRKKELHGLKSLVLANESTYSRDLYIRAAVTLLYAHWEGFIGQIGRYYIEFVGRRRLKNSELSTNFLAMAISSLVHDALPSSKIQPCLDLVRFFQSSMGSRSTIPWETSISTKSNLNSEVLREIVLVLGLDYAEFSTKEKLIDEKLLGNRNNIAHGRYLLVGFAEYLDLHEEVIAMMQGFYNQVSNSALLGSYRAK